MYIKELTTHATDGRDSTRTALNTLIEYGYVEKERKHNDDGTFAGFEYIVKESPGLSPIPISGNAENGLKDHEARNNTLKHPKPPLKAVETINGKTIDGLTVCGKPATNNKEVNNKDSTKKDDSKSSARGNSENDELHPLQKYVKDKLPEVSKLEKQLTAKNCKSLIDDFGKPQVHDVLMGMENYSGLTGKYKSVNLTIRNWCKMRNEGKPAKAKSTYGVTGAQAFSNDYTSV